MTHQGLKVSSGTMVFVPTYNEKDNVETMVSELLALPLDADLVFMDDNSPDGTGDILDRLAAANTRLSVMHRSDKLGIGTAHLEGIRMAYDLGYARLITLDCDFTHSPADVVRLVNEGAGFDVATGSRYLTEGSLPGWNLVRRSLTGFGHLLTTRLLGIPFDATGALRTYNLKRIPRELFDLVQARGYGFFFESMFMLVRNGHSIKEIPIVLPARTYGSSKMTVRETLRSGFRLLRLWGAAATKPARFRVSPPISGIDPSLTDTQGWNAYWEEKSRRSNKTYDIIASAYRVSVIRNQLRRFLKRHFDAGSHVLHAGCGGGQVDAGTHAFVKVTAVDISLPALHLYRVNNPHAFEVRHGDILRLPFRDEQFDGAYNLGVMEHFTIPDITRILQELHRVLRPGGKIVLFWPHARATSVAVLRFAHWLMNDIARTPTRFHPAEVSLLQSRQWVEALMHKSGFRVVQYSFGARDMFVQAVIVGEKTTPVT